MPPLTNNFRESNHRLCLWIERILLEHGQLALATPLDMGALISELLRGGEWLRAQPTRTKGDDPELDAELETYRSTVERIRELLPSIHSRLLAERRRLEAERARVESAEQWARASRQTL